MNDLIQLVQQHPWIAATLTSGAAYHVFSAAIDSLEPPDEKCGKFYRWFYKFTNKLAANYSRTK